jgi:hypothetical protein
VRSLRRRPAAGVPAARHGALLPAEILPAEILPAEILAAEILPAEMLAAEVRAGQAGAEAPLTGPGPPAELRPADAPGVVPVARVLTCPTAFPLAGHTAVPAPGLGLRSPAPSP